jgi:TRAP-type C4-dicarboxylate transport system substrate-binding protein
MNKAVILARNDNVMLNRSVRDKLTRRGMIFNDVDKDSFRKKLSDAKYYDRWKAEFGSKAWAALERYSNRLA